MTAAADTVPTGSYGARMPNPPQSATRSAEAFHRAAIFEGLYRAALDARDDAVRADHADGASDRVIASTVNDAVGEGTVSASNIRAIRNRNPELSRDAAATPSDFANALFALRMT